MAQSGKRWNAYTREAKKIKPRVKRDLSHLPKIPLKTLQTKEVKAALKKFRNKKVWKGCREQILNNEPLCRLCPENRKQAATTVHHIKTLAEQYPHFEDALNPENLVSLCLRCHSYVGQIENRNITEAKLLFIKESDL